MTAPMPVGEPIRDRADLRKGKNAKQAEEEEQKDLETTERKLKSEEGGREGDAPGLEQVSAVACGGLHATVDGYCLKDCSPWRSRRRIRERKSKRKKQERTDHNPPAVPHHPEPLGVGVRGVGNERVKWRLEEGGGKVLF